MNYLTQIKNTQKISRSEWELGLSEKASWHAGYSHSAYIYIGGLDYDLTEGDVLAVFAQYGEIIDINLIRDRKTEKSKGFAFLAYENQKSTILAVDNLNGARVAGRIIKVDHVRNYKQKVIEGDNDEPIQQDNDNTLKDNNDNNLKDNNDNNANLKEDNNNDNVNLKEEEENNSDNIDDNVNKGSVFDALGSFLKGKAKELVQKEKEEKKRQKMEEKLKKRENPSTSPTSAFEKKIKMYG